MKQTLNFRVLITLLAVCMGLLIAFGTFSLGFSGFSLEYSYLNAFKNTNDSFTAEGVLRLRLAGGVMLLAAVLAWIKPPFVSLAGGIASGAFFTYDTIRRLINISKYDFFEGMADFFIYIVPVVTCILFLLLFRKTRASQICSHTTQQPISNTTVNSPRVVDLRSEAEKKTEQESGNALDDAAHEAFAQELFHMFKTSRPYDSMKALEEVVEKYSPTAQRIANKGYNPALKKVYYRVMALCKNQGTYFHSGTLDSIFEGEYWSR